MVLLFNFQAWGASAEGGLEAGWENPPDSARLRAYWWWLNGNVTKESITHDLEQMRAKGFGGAVIFDADGAAQDGNAPVPHGPAFFSPEWRELYRHTLREADRLGLEISLNIQSGWNLGGPVVSKEDAAKKYVWSETLVRGGTNGPLKLPVPQHRDGFYRDIAVVAYRLKQNIAGPETEIIASSSQPRYAPKLAIDGALAGLWVSAGTDKGQGPTPQKPEFLQLNLKSATAISRVAIKGRAGYGPKECQIQVASDDLKFRTVKNFALQESGQMIVQFDPAVTKALRVVFLGAYDSGSPEAPRNVQVEELALPELQSEKTIRREPLANWKQKALQQSLKPFSAPDSSPLFAETPAKAGEQDADAASVINLSALVSADGTLNWNSPPGEWQVLRFGYTIGDHAYVSTSSAGWGGYALDVYSATAFDNYWDKIVAPLIADAGSLAGKSLKYLHTDSWEVELANWTPLLPEEFHRRHGYDLGPWLPVLAGRIIDSRADSDRFLFDYRKTLGDLAIDGHYRRFRERAHQHGLDIHPESGGPHAVPIDAQRCLGFNDAPMSEFWAWSWKHRMGDYNRFFVKQPASAAHTCGHKFVFAEGFTDIGPHWQESLWSNLKPAFDKALGEGLNMLVWHAFVCSPESTGIPGQQYFAGTHLNPKVTWWPESQAFFNYINRCQWMMQQGRFVADVLYYYGDHVPNFAQLKASDPAGILPGYDYDVITAEALIERAQVRDGHIELPDGMSYRVLVIPEREQIALPVLKKIKQLVAAGATVIGPQPKKGETRNQATETDAEIARLGAELWQGKAGSGRVIGGKTAREVLLADGVKPDCEFQRENGSVGELDYLHRRDGDTEIYFVASRTNTATAAVCTFRVSGKAPELWDPVTGKRQFAAAYHTSSDGRISVPLPFDPCGSWFVVFRSASSDHPPIARSNTPEIKSVQAISAPWNVHFDPRWGGPTNVLFDSLVDWTQRSEPGIKYYSGAATYEKVFSCETLPAPGHRWMLDLGDVRELATVRVNSRDCGITWCPPFRVDITEAVKLGKNKLEIKVVNFWPNRIIGDATLPREKRLTETNIRKLTEKTSLMESGLLGPVNLLEQAPDARASSATPAEVAK